MSHVRGRKEESTYIVSISIQAASQFCRFAKDLLSRLRESAAAWQKRSVHTSCHVDPNRQNVYNHRSAS